MPPASAFLTTPDHQYPGEPMCRKPLPVGAKTHIYQQFCANKDQFQALMYSVAWLG